MTQSSSAYLIGIDWGTSNMRLWVFDARGHICASAQSDKGMSTLRPDEYEDVIDTLLAPYEGQIAGLHEVPRIICGMAGAATGWQEAGYLSTPAALSGLGDHAVTVTGARARTYIIPGVAQRDEACPDVMRGEETLLYGACLSQAPEQAHYCLPGTHAKWVTMKRGAITAFSTFMTGELYHLLLSHSVLGPALAARKGDDGAFYEGVTAGARGANPLSAEFFSTRASALLFPDAPASTQAYLSGLLIGHECAANRQVGLPLYLVASSDMAARYQKALTHLEMPYHIVAADEAAQQALWHIGKDMRRREDG